MPYILALDEGTTSARAALYDRQARRVSMAAVPTVSHFPQPGWVEQDASLIWQSQLEAVRNTLGLAGIAAKEVHAIGITNQRETTVVWDRATGQPVAPAIVWQCRRTAARCRELAAQLYDQLIAAVPDPRFLNQAAYLAAFMGDRAKAERFAGSAPAPAPNDPTYGDTRGEIAYFFGDFTAASQYFEQNANRNIAYLNLNPAVGNAGAAREAQFHCAAQLLRTSPNG